MTALCCYSMHTGDDDYGYVTNLQRAYRHQIRSTSHVINEEKNCESDLKVKLKIVIVSQ